MRIKHVILRMLAILLIALYLINPNIVQSEEFGKVLIVNSDSSIENYLTAESQFKAEFTGDIVVVDLGDRWFSENDLQKVLRKEKPKIIYAIGAKAYAMTNRISKDVKVVFSSVANSSRLPIDTRTSGISNELNVGMQVTLYRYLFPRLERIGIIYSKEFNEGLVGKFEKSALKMGIKLVKRTVKHPDEIQPSLQSLLPEIDALWLIADPVVLSSSSTVKEIFDTSHSEQIPIVAYSEVFTNIGASLILSADIPTIAKQAAIQVKAIQKAGGDIKQKIADPAGSRIILNMKKVKEYGLELNPKALLSVDTIIK